MKQNFTKLCSLLLAALLVLSVLPAAPLQLSARAEDTDFVNDYEPMDDYTAPEADVETASLPASYDLRAENALPAVRSQGGYGTCWSFATIAAAESNLIKQGLADPSVDLSELHLVYYMYTRTKDPLGNYDGDGAAARDGEKVGGGRSDYAMNVLARWNGVVDEQLMPYKDAALTETCTYPDAYANEYNAFLLNGYYAINLKKNPEALKAAIMENGAAAISYFADDKYMTDDVSYFAGDNHKGSTNHGVAIVGWDDNYAASNFGDLFNGDLRPEKDGAWLIRNSWGTWNHDAGYFWMSYEEGSLDETAFVVKMQPADAYDYNYQYDGGVYYSPAAKTFGAANKFMAQHNETLNAVSVAFPEDANVRYSVDIYLNPETADVATLAKTGTPEAYAHTEGSTTYAGMYTIELANGVALTPGDVFFVVIRAESEDGKAVRVSYDKSMPYSDWFDGYTKYDEEVSYYVGAAGDLTEMKGRGVARIKAFTTENDIAPAPANLTASVSGLLFGKKAELSWDAVDGAERYTVYVSDGGEFAPAAETEDCAFAYALGSDAGKVVSFKVAAVVNGEEGRLSNACGVQNPAYEAVSPESVTLNYPAGEGETPALTVEQKIPAAIDYTVAPENASVYFRSSNEKIARVTNAGVIEGLAPGSVTLTAYSGTKALDAKLNVTVLAHTNHVYEPVAAKAATCAQVGWDAYEACVYCGEANGEINYLPAAGHQPQETAAAVGATCISAGVTAEEVCAVCGKVMSPAVPVPMTAHTLQLIPAVAPTCTEKGSNAYYECTFCHNFFADPAAAAATTAEQNVDVIEPNGHTLSEVPAKEATCVSSGNKAYYACTVCGALFEDAEATVGTTAEAVKIAPTGEHTAIVTREAKAPTCTEDGWTEASACSVCGKVLTAGAPVKATGHDLFVAAPAVAPTCTAKGATARIECRNCDLYVLVSKDVDALGHTPYESKKAVAATCTAVGSTAQISCSVCGEVLVEAEEIAMLEHTFVTTTSEATCTKDGGTVTKCAVCGTVESQELVPAAGHVDADENKICDVCGELLYDENDPNAPTETKVDPANCKHMCHKRPEGLFGIIWQIVNVINRLLGVNQYCACGAKHW